ncbi:glycosyltransferase [Bacillus sp. FJAT-27251]|uniref:glycosyltransferase family 2 protein n=1 Tax=Bacillus sp. FJAT-27251 TaxID=1684142 RepID=UPI0006A77693|nr:glycosyltransferase [Bacillus sp. FJAT-27251]
MLPNLSPVRHEERNYSKSYITVTKKFWISHAFALIWTAFSIYLSVPWLDSLSSVVPWIAALLIIGGIAYIPGYMNAFLLSSLLLDRQPKYKNERPADPVTVLIAAYNEEKGIFNTLSYVAGQDYSSRLKVIVVDNDSSDATPEEVLRAKEELRLDILLVKEKRKGKFHALNKGLRYVRTPYLITLDADTLLHPSAIRYMVARLKSSPEDVCAVAGSMLVRNSRESIWTRIQEWEYFLGIASIKRLQGLYQGTLVAQGAFSLYKTSYIREIQGWPDAIGEDIVLTWRLLGKGWKVYFEPLAAAFTDTPVTIRQLIRQRSRWARGMIEGLKEIKPWKQPQIYTKYLTGINFVMPYLDVVYTFFWIPGLVLAFFGIFWIVGPMTLFVLPLTLVSYGLLYRYQKRYVFENLQLNIRKNKLGFLLYILFYQMIMSPVSVLGYLQELFRLRRVWK